jgi:iron complex transport system ATP-binding protein
VTLIVQHLRHRYGDVEALRGVSAQAMPGRITAVLGPNASGKSTLLRCIIGAIRPTAGVVLIDGTPAHAMSAYYLAQKISYVPQRSVVSASFTVREVVELGRYALPASPARIDEALLRMELVCIADRPYAALSVGQQQRVTMARALAQLAVGKVPSAEYRAPSGDDSVLGTRNSELQQPTAASYLILDEPVSGMDLRHVQDVMSLLRQLAACGTTILVAMHDLSLAASVADDAWLLDDGRLVVAGSVEEVLDAERLSAVFEVEFEWIRSPRGTPTLLAVKQG